MEKKQIKKFLNLFEYTSDAERTFITDYVCSKLEQAESEGKVLEFEELSKPEHAPNPLLDRKGDVMFKTDSFIKFFNDYTSRVKYVKTEIANLVREDYLIMRDIAVKPLNEVGKIK